ncbi:MAG: hypothetical protein ABIH24_04680 [Verrucomicrobiota bacterium]
MTRTGNIGKFTNSVKEAKAGICIALVWRMPPEAAQGRELVTRNAWAARVTVY